MVVEIRELIKRFDGKLALDCFNLEVGEGEVVGLLGPNGAGKTTSIRALVGLLPVDDGTIKVFGLRPSSDRSPSRYRSSPCRPPLTSSWGPRSSFSAGR